jgi:hypothetical protein
MFKTLDVIEPNKEVLELVKRFNGISTKGEIKALMPANVKVITPAIFRINMHNETIIICEYKGEIRGNKNFYISSLQNFA